MFNSYLCKPFVKPLPFITIDAKEKDFVDENIDSQI